MEFLFKMHKGNVCQMHLLTMMYELAKKPVVMYDMRTEIKLVFQASINYRDLQLYKFEIKKCLVKQTLLDDRAASGHR